MTKREMFEVIRNYFENAGLDEVMSLDTQNAVSVDEVLAFCDKEIEHLAARKASSKPTKTQEENEVYKEAMLATMATLDRPVTISELQELCEGIAGLKNQRVSALMTQLKNKNRVIRTVEKKKAYFSINRDEVEAV